MPDPQTQQAQLFEQVEDYPWDQDADFQGGLEAILGASPSPEQIQELTLRARCYYYERKHSCPPLDFDAYKHWRMRRDTWAVGGTAANDISPSSLVTSSNLGDHAAQSTAAASNSAPDPAAPYPNSFAQIADLIARGEPIPGIKEIPDTVLSGKGSESRTAKRRKPWEKDSGDSEINALQIGGTFGPEPKSE